MMDYIRTNCFDGIKERMLLVRSFDHSACHQGALTNMYSVQLQRAAVITKFRYSRFEALMSDTIAPTPILTWVNVGLGLSFIGFDVIVSTLLGLGVGPSLFTAALRCILQLALVAGLLQKVFEAQNPWAVAGITCKRGLIVPSQCSLTILVLSL